MARPKKERRQISERTRSALASRSLQGTKLGNPTSAGQGQRLAKAVGLALLSVGAELAIDDQDALVQAIQSGAQDTINDAAVQRDSDVEGI